MSGAGQPKSPSKGDRVRVHLHGRDHLGVVVSLTRSRATVRYLDTSGDERTVKMPIGAVQVEEQERVS